MWRSSQKAQKAENIDASGPTSEHEATPEQVNQRRIKILGSLPVVYGVVALSILTDHTYHTYADNHSTTATVEISPFSQLDAELETRLTPEQLQAVKKVYEHPATHAENEPTPSCLEPSKEDIDQAHLELTRDGYHKIDLTEAPIENYTNDDLRRLYAEELGLTMPGMSEAMTPLIENAANPDSPDLLSLEDFTAQASEILRQNYGVEIDLKFAKPFKAGVSEVDLDTLDPEANQRLKSSIITLLEAFNRLPVEYVESAELKKVIFASIEKTKDDYYTIAIADLDHDTMILKSDEALSIDTVYHELFHQWHYVICGREIDAMVLDPSFGRLNPVPSADFYTHDTYDRTPTDPNYKTLLEYPSDKSQLVVAHE